MTYKTPAERLAALEEVLEGIHLSPHENRIVGWISGWDPPTVDAVVAILRKCRAGAYHGLDEIPAGGQEQTDGTWRDETTGLVGGGLVTDDGRKKPKRRGADPEPQPEAADA